MLHCKNIYVIVLPAEEEEASNVKQQAATDVKAKKSEETSTAKKGQLTRTTATDLEVADDYDLFTDCKFFLIFLFW